MPYCSKCGRETPEGQKFCSSCGAPMDASPARSGAYDTNPRGNTAALTCALIFMILSCAACVIAFIILATIGGTLGSAYGVSDSGLGIGMGIVYLIPLAWIIPMTIRTAKIRKGEKPNTVVFGVLTLIFGNLIAGICLLVSPKDE